MKKDNKTNELNNTGSEQSASANTDDRGTVTKIVIIKSSGRHGAWWVLGTLAVVLIVLAAIWMWGQSSALSNLGGTVNQNNAAQSAQLAGLRNTLSAIAQQLRQMQVEIASLFSRLIHLVHP